MIPQLKERKLKTIRKDKGLSITRLANLSGIQQGLIGQIEMGRYIPYAVQLQKLADALGWQGNPEELLEEVE